MTRMSSAVSDLSCSIVCIYKSWGGSEALRGESLTTAILVNLSFLYIPPLQGLSPHSLCTVHLLQYSCGE